jgi:adenine C2-methylase RlmN of 23S rRNA A2503 and tRNA A37
MVESRYVRRHPDYFIVYISSQTGCRKACRMCHLTQTAQVQADDLPVTAIVDQAREVLGWYDAHAEPAKVVHFNFMARGEPFANPHILTEGGRLMASLSEEALKRRLVPRVKFSSIFPHELTDVDRLATLFGGYTPDIYYSIYSMDAGFRRRWLPKALPPETSLEMLKEYQSQTRKIPVLHFAFIAGENDSTDNIEEICAAVNRIKLRVDLNIVRYNPHSARTGAEPSEDVIHRNAALF